MVQKIKISKAWPSGLKKILKTINGVHLPIWLIVILALSLLLRVPSFFEPYSYGDETIYLALGEAVNQGKVLYKDIHDNKPPLLYLLAAVSHNLFWFKAILAFWSLITIVLFWKLVVHLFPDKKRLQQSATLVFALLTTLPLLEGNIANAENFMIGFTILGFYILLTRPENFKNIFLGGTMFAVSTLFKVPAAFDLPAIVFYWLIVSNFKNLKDISKKTSYLLLGFAIPILLTFVWYAMRGALQDYLISGYLQNFGYLSTFRPTDVQKPFLVKNAPLLIRGVLVLLGTLVLYIFRKKLSKQFIFITVWLFLTLFAVTLSERPYPHYLLQSVAPVAILMAMLFTLQTVEQTLVIIPLCIFLIVPVYYRFWYYSTSAYYQRFFGLFSGESRDVYLVKFGSHVPRSYNVAEFILATTTKADGVFVWGAESQTIYALARRFPPIKYVAQYHINDFSSPKEVFMKVAANPPKIVVILPNAPEFPTLTSYLKERYILINEIDGALIYLLPASNYNTK